MSQRKFPRYPKKPHATGQARITVNGSDVYLGPWSSDESHQKYNRLLVQWHANGGHASPAQSPDITVAEVLAHYWRYAENIKYRGSRELESIADCLLPVTDLFGSAPAADFDGRSLKAVQAEMMRRGWCRNTINRHIHRVRHAWKWIESERLVPKGNYDHLLTVESIATNHPDVRNTEEVQPARWEDVLAVAKRLRRMPRHMLLLMWWSGMRTAEMREMRTHEIDRTGDVWLYRPGRHKNAWRGLARVIALGPKCQALIRPYLLPSKPDAFIFSPRREREERFRTLRAKRKTRVQPSQRCRKKKKAKRMPGECYTRLSFAQAVTRVAKKLGLILRPYMCRHAARLRITRELGMDAARAMLGHRKFDTTAHYGGADTELATRAARKLG